MYTVAKLAALAGVTPRTLRHYDAIGLLRPGRVAANGYRQYGEAELLRLQQILFYRELEIPLEEIGAILDRPGFDARRALEEHREELRRRIGRLERLLGTVEGTIAMLEGRKAMDHKGFYEGFSEEEQARYAEEAERLYDPETVRASQRRWKAYPQARKEAILAEGRAVYEAFAARIGQDPGSAPVQELVAAWRRHMDWFWTPEPAQLLGIAEGYVADPRFKATFDRLDPRLAEFLRDAVRVYVERLARGLELG